MKLIDADALIADLDKGLWGKDYDKALAEAIIREAPSIDIVRCGECTERDDDWCMYFGKMINPDDFCSYGEREGE